MCVGLSFMSSEENVRYVVAVYGVAHVSERIFSFVCVCVFVCFLQLGPWTLTGLSLFRESEHC